MPRKRIQRLTTYDKTIIVLCQLHNCTTKDARNIYQRRLLTKILPE